MLYCVTCGNPRQLGRRECRPCAAKSAVRRAQARYKKYGRSTVYTYTCVCCSAPYTVTRKSSTTCHACLKIHAPFNDGYVYSAKANGRLVWEHRVIAEMCYPTMPPNCHVHHLNGDGKDNQLSNLMILSGSAHARLHAACDKFYRQLLGQLGKAGAAEKWKVEIVDFSITWLQQNQLEYTILSELPP